MLCAVVRFLDSYQSRSECVGFVFADFHKPELKTFCVEFLQKAGKMQFPSVPTDDAL
jgi:hypothetical protein